VTAATAPGASPLDSASTTPPAAGWPALLTVIEHLAGLVLAVDVLVVFASVIFRYFLHNPVDWAEEIARALMVTQVFLGAATVLARGQHVGIDAFPRPAAKKLAPGDGPAMQLDIGDRLCGAVPFLLRNAGRFQRPDHADRPAAMDLCLSGGGRKFFHDPVRRRQCIERRMAHCLDHAGGLRGHRPGDLGLEHGLSRAADPPLVSACRGLSGQHDHRRADRLCAGVFLAAVFPDRSITADADLFTAGDGGHGPLRPAGNSVFSCSLAWSWKSTACRRG